MRRLAICAVILLLAPALVAQERPVVRLVEFDAAITPVSARRILQAIEDAEQAGDDLVLIELDTPGGLVASMETIVKKMLAAQVPIAVWVGPAGAKAASAGFFLLIAADVATMAPGTRTGAASPILPIGENPKGDVRQEKATQDLAALIRSVADQRGRNAEACQEAVFEAKAWEERVALEKGLIDFVVPSRDALLEQLEGREVQRFDGSISVLRTANATFARSEFSLQHKFMEFLANPALASVLLLIGMLGLYVEFTNPGGIFPGVIGALCLLLFALTLQVLPVSAVGVLLILLAIVMFVLEVKVTSYGLLTLGGTISLVIGSLMLIDGPIPALRVPPTVVLPTALVVALLCVLAMRLAVRAHRDSVATGAEGLVAEFGVVTQDLAPAGRVRIHGEIWDAISASAPIGQGRRVRVVRVDNLQLTVEPADPTPSGSSPPG